MKFINPFDTDPTDNYKAAPTPARLQKNSRVAILTADNAEDLEFFYPYYRFSEAGYIVDVITPEGGEFEGKSGLGLKETMHIEAANANAYDLLYIPGGKAPQELIDNEKVMNFVREYARTNKPIASICHGAQVLIKADLVRGKRISAWPEIKDEVEEAGATFVDEALVIDGKFITSRKPGDLHRHLAGALEQLGVSQGLKTSSAA